MRARLKTVASWALMLGCTGFIVQLFVSDQADLGILARLSLQDVVVITLLQVGLLLLGSFRYLLVVEKCSGQHIPFLPWLRIYVIARLFNLIVPQAGNMYRGLRLKKHFQVSYTRYAGSFIAFAWIGASLNLAIAAAMVVIWAPEREIVGFPAYWWLLLLALSIAFGPLLLDQALQRMQARGRRIDWLRARLGEAIGAAVFAVADRGHLSLAVALGLASFAFTCLIFYACFSSLGIAIGVGELALFYALLQLSTYVHLTPGNLAIQEIAFGVMSQQIGLEMGEGIVVAAVLRLSGYAALSSLAAWQAVADAFRQARSARP